MRRYWVYILASQPRGTLYIGVTNDILGRIGAHKSGKGSIFTARYRVTILVYFEEFADIRPRDPKRETLKRLENQPDRTR